jgi:hypothetical protein
MVPASENDLHLSGCESRPIAASSKTMAYLLIHPREFRPQKSRLATAFLLLLY